jgi:hypothetical protein
LAGRFETPKSTSSGPGESVLIQAPAQGIDPVLAKKRLTPQHHRRHTPMARLFQCALVAPDFIEVITVNDGRFQFVEVEAG